MSDEIDIARAYQEALDNLYDLIDFERKRMDRYMASKLDATRPQRLLRFLGEPQERFPSIHIAGTKGKGSVAAICAASLRAAGLRVGLYTSPHVREFRERIRILTPEDADGRISKADFVALMQEMEPAIDRFPDLTWFEVVTAVAFLYFARRQVDVAVIEVGLGGRLDATNVIRPLVSVITSLSLDHTDLLGDTLPEIAAEKGGIIKQGVPLVTAPQPPEALQVLAEIAEERSAPMTVVGRDWVYQSEAYEGGEVDGKEEEGGRQHLVVVDAPESDLLSSPTSFPLALKGQHQLENATVALATLDLVRPHFPALTRQAVASAMANVEWIGRLQVVHQEAGTPTLLVDCAHNPDSAAKLRHALIHDYDYERLRLILGAPADKDVAGVMTQLLPLATTAVMTTADHPRAATPAELALLAAELGYEAIACPTVAEALTVAWQLAGPEDLICVTGSIILVGDLLNQWESLQSHLLQNYAYT